MTPGLGMGKVSDREGAEDQRVDFLKTWSLVKRYRSSLFFFPSPEQGSSESVLDGTPIMEPSEMSLEAGWLFILCLIWSMNGWNDDGDERQVMVRYGRTGIVGRF